MQPTLDNRMCLCAGLRDCRISQVEQQHSVLSGMSSYTTWQCSDSRVAQDTVHLTDKWEIDPECTQNIMAAFEQQPHTAQTDKILIVVLLVGSTFSNSTKVRWGDRWYMLTPDYSTYGIISSPSAPPLSVTTKVKYSIMYTQIKHKQIYLLQHTLFAMHHLQEKTHKDWWLS